MRLCAHAGYSDPVPDATVEVLGTSLRGRTGADGCATIAGVPVGTVTLYVVPAEASGLAPVHSGSQLWRSAAEAIPVRDDEVTTEHVFLYETIGEFGWDPEGPVGGLAGCVRTWHQTGVPAMAVVVEHAGGTIRTTTGEDGCYRVGAVRLGPATVRVEPPAGSGLRMASDRYPNPPDPAPRVVDVHGWSWQDGGLWVSRAARVSGRVVDDAGTPVAGSPVWLVGPLGANTVTDADGRWSTWVEPGDLTVVVPAPGYRDQPIGWFPTDPLIQARTSQKAIRVEAATDVGGVDLEVVRVARITGRVLDERGAPQAGVPVTAWRDDRSTGWTQSGPDGGYVVELPPSAVRVFAGGANRRVGWFGPDGTAATARTLALAPGQTAGGVDVVVPPGTTIAGRVVDTSGRPVRRAVIMVVHETREQAERVGSPWDRSRDGQTWPAASAEADAGGKWTTPPVLADGRYVVRVFPPGLGSDWVATSYGEDVGLAPIPLAVRVGAPRSGITIVMRRAGEPPPTPTRTLRAARGVVTLPLACPTGCRVVLRQAAGRSRARTRRPVLARGRARVGATQVRLRLTHAGRQAVAHRQLRVTARVRPGRGRVRSLTLRLEPGR